MTDNNSSSDSSGKFSIQDIACVGGVFEFRMKRDLGIETIRDVARCELKELQEVWGIGEIRSQRIKGSAQGLVEKMESMIGNNEQRVAVFSGEGSMPKDADVAFEAIEGALQVAGVEVDSNTRIGHVTGEMGGDMIKQWYDYQVTFGDTNPRVQPFETPWEKYRPFCDDDYDGEVDLSVIETMPGGIERADQVSWGLAPMERTRDMVRWADKVVIVIDGEYAGSVRYECEMQDVDESDYTTVFDIKELGGDVTLVPWEEPDHEVRTNEPEEDSTYVGGAGPREGSVDDLSSEHWLDEPADDDESRKIETIEHDDPGGTGIGKKMDDWH